MSLIKHDEGKLQWHLLPLLAVRLLVRVLMHGAAKYKEWNWAEGGDYSRLYDAALRHLTAWWDGEDLDPDSGMNHLAHAACCCLFLLEMQIREIPEDNRRTWR